MCEKTIRKQFIMHDPDVVVSVHPLMTNIPVYACEKISRETGRHLPIFTVVTDLASAHCLWFANGVDKLYIASEECRKLAKQRGKVPDEKIVQIGLPIRHQFAVQADKLGDRNSPQGVEYQRKIKAELELPSGSIGKKTLLVMGGGEGVGSLSSIVDSLYVELSKQGIDALILVVCGRNEILKKGLEERDWDAVVHAHKQAKLRPSRSLLSFSACVTAPVLPAIPAIPAIRVFVGSGKANNSANSSSTTEINKNLSTIDGINKSTSPRSSPLTTGCMDGSVTQQIQRILSSSNLRQVGNAFEDASYDENQKRSPTSDDISGEEGSVPSMIEVQNSADGDEVEVVEIPPVASTSTETNDDENKDVDADENKDANTNADTTSAEAAESTVTNPISIPPIGAPPKRANVTVIGLGFVTKMAEYMVAADILVSKAGPGTIAEAASLSLPVMLTSFLPGQEQGNVDFVVDGGFGAFISDRDPQGIAEEVGSWLVDDEKLSKLSMAAKKSGAPHAARDIVKSIGKITHKWLQLNEDRIRLNEETEKLKLGMELSMDEEEDVEVEVEVEVEVFLTNDEGGVSTSS